MKYLVVAFLLITGSCAAQADYDRITLSRFTGLRFYSYDFKNNSDSGYKARISGEVEVYSKADRKKKTTPYLITLLQQIRANGTEDISKCFIPRHAINFYKGEKIVKAVVVCFECDGVRFTGGEGSTRIKNGELRIKQMGMLSKIFSDSGFFENPGFIPIDSVRPDKISPR